jgi:hypothetical protein
MFLLKGNKMKKTLTLASSLCIFLFSGCTTFTNNTNRESSIPTPTVASTNSLADVEIGEKIFGSACADTIFWVFSNDADEKYLEIEGTHGSSTVDRAKSEAIYQALAGKNGLTTDIMVHPVWSINVHRDWFRFHVTACAQVTGYRGVIKSIVKSNTITDPANKKSDASNNSGILSNLVGIFTSDKTEEKK